MLMIVWHATMEQSVPRVPDSVKIARPAKSSFALMPTRPTAPTARLGSSNLWGVKQRVRIVQVASINPKTGCRIVCLAFRARTKIILDQRIAWNVTKDNIKILLVRQPV